MGFWDWNYCRFLAIVTYIFPQLFVSFKEGVQIKM
jgi:hypothetical protein